MKIDRLARPRISADEAIVIAKDCFGVSCHATELAGERDRNFLMSSTSGEKFVLKIGNAADNKSVIDFQNQLLLHLSSAETKWSWPVPQSDRQGQLISQWGNDRGEELKVRLLTFIDGIFLADFLPHSFSLMKEIGQFLGSVTKSLGSFSHPAMDRPLFWDMRNGIYLVKRHLDEIADEARRIQDS